MGVDFYFFYIEQLTLYWKENSKDKETCSSTAKNYYVGSKFFFFKSVVCDGYTKNVKYYADSTIQTYWYLSDKMHLTFF
jgi:hypothetical protein